MHTVTNILLLLGSSPWSYAVLAILLVIDGFFPFVPGETLVVTMAVLSTTSHGPNLWGVLGVAVVSTAVGDAIAFALGRRIGVTRWAWMRRPQIAAAFAWADRGLSRRPAAVMMTAKFIPIARVAVTMTAGATGFPLRRYIMFSVTASIVYTGYHVTVGFLAGNWLAANPVLGILAAIVSVVVLGTVIDAGGRARNRASERRLRADGTARARQSRAC